MHTHKLHISAIVVALVLAHAVLGVKIPKLLEKYKAEFKGKSAFVTGGIYFQNLLCPHAILFQFFRTLPSPTGPQSLSSRWTFIQLICCQKQTGGIIFALQWMVFANIRVNFRETRGFFRRQRGSLNRAAVKGKALGPRSNIFLSTCPLMVRELH